MLYFVLAAWLGLVGPGPEAPVTSLQLPGGKVVQAELMIDDRHRALGLMFRKSLPEDRVLLFVFEGLAFHGIWMKNCLFPIDIVWLDEDRRVVHVDAAVPPCAQEPCPVYQPMARALYVVEMNAGQAAREGLAVGDRLSFELPR